MKKEEPEEKQEPMEVGEKKMELKTEPKEAEVEGTNRTSSSSPSRKKGQSAKPSHDLYEDSVTSEQNQNQTKTDLQFDHDIEHFV